VSDGHLVVQPQVKPRYSLKELLAPAEDAAAPAPPDREWLDSPAIGRELL
jgi:antitoxin ChpS